MTDGNIKRSPGRDSIYIILFFFLALMYGAYSFLFEKPQQEPSASPELQEFYQAEKNWEQSPQKKEVLEQFLKDHPVTAAVFNLLSFLILGFFCGGIVLNVLLIMRPSWRRHIAYRNKLLPENWTLNMLFQVLFFWVLANLVLSVLVAFIGKRYLFPGLELNVYLLVHTTLMDGFAILLILYVLAKKGQGWKELGFDLSGRSISKEAGIGVLGYMSILPVFFIVLIFLVTLARLLGYQPPAHPLVEIFLEEEKRSPYLILYSIVLASIIGPVVEEIFFRGFFYPIIRKKWGIGWAMVITSGFFALIHQNEFAFWPIFILGLGLAWLYEIRRNLVAPITLHVLHNSFFITYFFLAKQIILAQQSGG